MKALEVKLITHRGESRIAVRFEPKAELIARFKQLEGRRWSSSLQVWHLPDNNTYRSMFQLPLKGQENISEETLHKIHHFQQHLLSKRYSSNTIKVYIDCVTLFFNYNHHISIDEVNNDTIIQFNNDYILKKNLSATYQNQFINGLKLFYKLVGSQHLEIELIRRPRPEHRLPNVLSKEEVKAILQASTNVKHRTMLSLIYACGLRRSELLNLKPTDILSDRHLIHVFQSKGKKDRIVPITDKILEMLRSYYLTYRPKVWLFEGQTEGQPYSAKSLQSILKQALVKAKINKPVTLHWLRHSYATHLLESGTDLRYIQELLGHNSSRTTEIYTHVSTRDIQRIKSPFDDL
jgi:integrase/recombinase XerD